MTPSASPRTDRETRGIDRRLAGAELHEFLLQIQAEVFQVKDLAQRAGAEGRGPTVGRSDFAANERWECWVVVRIMIHGGE